MAVCEDKYSGSSSSRLLRGRERDRNERSMNSRHAGTAARVTNYCRLFSTTAARSSSLNGNDSIKSLSAFGAFA